MDYGRSERAVPVRPVFRCAPFLAKSILFQAALGASFITGAEFLTGAVVNLWLGWNVWDYAGETGNLLGQICPLFSFYWFCLCCAVFGVLRLLCYVGSRVSKNSCGIYLPLSISLT